MPPFLQNAFQELGNTCLTVFAQNPLTAVLSAMESFQPDLIISIQNVAFLASDLLTKPCFSKIKKAILFYDDPVGSFQLFGKKNPLITSFEALGVSLFIWDGYWVREVKKDYSKKCFTTHLSAEREYFSPEKTDLIPGIKHCVIFLGNVPKEQLLESISNELPVSHRKIAEVVNQRIQSGPYGCNPFEMLSDTLKEAPESDRNSVLDSMNSYLHSVPDLSKPFAPHIQLRRHAWLCGKRETRLRALRALAKVAPVAILSNLKDDQNMAKDEFSKELQPGKGKDLLFIDTSHVTYYQLGHLYASGLFHFQSTDPQSVEGGIPYRVFQSAACATPLVSDYKKELVECFSPHKEILIYRNEDELSDVVSGALNNISQIKEMGKAAHQRFLNEHTWVHRMKKLLEDIG